jgi:hypothetical protein
VNSNWAPLEKVFFPEIYREKKSKNEKASFIFCRSKQVGEEKKTGKGKIAKSIRSVHFSEVASFPPVNSSRKAALTTPRIKELLCESVE